MDDGDAAVATRVSSIQSWIIGKIARIDLTVLKQIQRCGEQNYILCRKGWALFSVLVYCSAFMTQHLVASVPPSLG